MKQSCKGFIRHPSWLPYIFQALLGDTWCQALVPVPSSIGKLVYNYNNYDEVVKLSKLIVVINQDVSCL